MQKAYWIRTGVSITGWVAIMALPAYAQIRPAPEGEATVTAQMIIHAEFDGSACPRVVAAQRVGDGSIKALCNNRETFRGFFLELDAVVALQCSGFAKMGVEGCFD